MKNVITLLLAIASCSFSIDQDDERQIRSVLDQQIIAWNKGDLSEFMQGYWRSDSLMFVGKSGITYGYNSTLARYQKYYPDQAAMGKLSFDILHVKRIDANHFFVIGKYILERADDKPEGHFTVIFKKIDGAWKIICDHSS